MWANPYHAGLSLHSMLTPPVGVCYTDPNYPSWLPGNINRAVDKNLSSQKETLVNPRLPITETQGPIISPHYGMFYPPFYPLIPTAVGIPGELQNGNGKTNRSQLAASRPTMGVLEEELTRINDAMQSGEPDEKYSRFIKKSDNSPLSPAITFPVSRMVHSPPLMTTNISIESPKAASTPAKVRRKAQPKKEQKSSLLRNNDACRHKEEDVDDKPLDLRVHKRSFEDSDHEPSRDTKRRKTETFTLNENILTTRSPRHCSYDYLSPSDMHKTSCYKDSGLSESPKTGSTSENIMPCSEPKGNLFLLSNISRSRNSLSYGESSDLDSLTREVTHDSGFSAGDLTSRRSASAVSKDKKVYRCPHPGCEKSFLTKGTLRHHAFVHTDTFKCSWPDCGKRFRDDYNLRTHYMTHTGRKPRQCPLCDYTCVQKNSMNWHMKTKHKS